jgi:hypothetical protein
MFGARVEAYRDRDGKTRHRTVINLGDFTFDLRGVAYGCRGTEAHPAKAGWDALDTDAKSATIVVGTSTVSS